MGNIYLRARSPTAEYLACTEEFRVQFSAGPFEQFRGSKDSDKQAKLRESFFCVVKINYKSYSI